MSCTHTFKALITVLHTESFVCVRSTRHVRSLSCQLRTNPRRNGCRERKCQKEQLNSFNNLCFLFLPTFKNFPLISHLFEVI